jgi:hypothetical protein
MNGGLWNACYIRGQVKMREWFIMILLPKHLVVWEHRVIVTSFGLVGMIIID